MADSRSESLRQAILEAKGGNSSKALELLLASPAADHSPDAALHHYTTGVLFLQSGQAGRALAHLEKSRALGGSGPQLADALSRARMATGGALDQASYPWERFADSSPYVLVEVTALALAVGFSVALWRKRAQIRSAAICWLAAGSLVALQAWSDRREPARALETCALRSGPGEDFVKVRELPPGSELRLIGALHPRSSGWRQVRISRGKTGWLEQRCLLPLRAGSHTPRPRTTSE
jgi:hypothetical protein